MEGLNYPRIANGAIKYVWWYVSVSSSEECLPKVNQPLSVSVIIEKSPLQHIHQKCIETKIEVNCGEVEAYVREKNRSAKKRM